MGLAVFLAACSGEESDRPDASVTDGGVQPELLPFLPSNLPAELAFSVADDLVFSAASCGPRAEIDTVQGKISCFEPGGFNPAFTYSVTRDVEQSDGSKVTVFAGRNIRIEADTEVQIRGDRPLVLVALGSITIAGKLTALDAIAKYQGQAGGASEPEERRANGLGAGGGEASAGEAAGAGGASFCGLGGRGGADTDPVLAPGGPGAAYGSSELIPLVAGSSGGKNGNHSGAGGGAVQLVAADRIEITTSGAINMGGRGGGWFGGGGGSGGAILLEGEAVTIAGTLGANGGGGGGGSSAGGEDGADGEASSAAAAGGGGGAGGTPGGAGSAGDTVNGADSTETDGQAGGGGGGAGRIRINAEAAPAITGTLSPSAATACVTVGTITPRP